MHRCINSTNALCLTSDPMSSLSGAYRVRFKLLCTPGMGVI